MLVYFEIKIYHCITLL